MDIGFGDVITPEREKRSYPTLLDLPAPRLWTYSRETMVAEKIEAMVSLGADNSRVKDLWDIACLARGFAFDGETLRTAIDETCRRAWNVVHGREAGGAAPQPTTTTPHARSTGRCCSGRSGPDADGPARLADAGEELQRFLGPVCDSVIDGESVPAGLGPPAGPWQLGIQGRTEGDDSD